MKKFKKGDRVTVYGNLGKGHSRSPLPVRDEDYYSSGGVTGVVQTVYCDSELNIKLDKDKYCWKRGCVITAHPYQCRRLIKRKKSGAV